MSSLTHQTVDYFLRTRRTSTRGANSVKRTIIPIGKELVVRFKSSTSFDAEQSLIMNARLNGNRELTNLKAMLYLRQKQSRVGSPLSRINTETVEYGEKIGLVTSGSRLGRAAQAAGSFVTPGNISPLRSPIRSGIYRALTPGGGGGLRRLLPNRNERGYRCPAGFEFGGRFTDNQYSTCGAQLFEIPGPLALAARAIRRAVSAPDARVESLSQVVEGNASPDRAVQIQRMAQIPRNAAPDKARFSKSVEDAIKVLKAAPAGEGRMIRRDGVVLRPVVPSSVLRQFSGNPDMLDGAMIRAVQLPKDIASDDVALLAGASMSQIVFIAPNGVSIRIERARPLTVGERRKFGRQLNRAIGDSDEYEVGANIRRFAEQTNGAFKYTEDYASVPQPLEFVTYTGADGVERKVRRWVYETFIKGTNKVKK
jgi:hypothetical protein